MTTEELQVLAESYRMLEESKPQEEQAVREKVGRWHGMIGNG